MPGCGTRTFAQPEPYEAALRQGLTEAVITPCGKFQARLTWVELHNMEPLRCEEDLPRIGYLSLAPQLAVVASPISSSRFPVWRGITLHAENIMLHSRGERVHQAMSAASVWAVIAIDPGQLENYGRVLAKNPLLPPPEGRVLQPSRRDLARLRRLHRQARRLAETNPKVLAHPEVARAIEQGLIHALVTCLATANVESDGGAKRHHARNHDPLREGVGGPPHPAAARSRFMRADRCDRPNLAVLLRRISRHPLCDAASAETGERRIAQCR